MSVIKFQRDTTDLFNYPSDQNPTTQADYISAVKNWQETERNLVDSVLWQPDTDYAIGAVVKTPSIPSQYILVCTQAGTSGTEEPDYTDVSTGYSVSDGTAIWRVETIVSLDKVNDMFTNIIELIESGEALTGDMWSLDIEENMVANKDNIVPKTNGVSKLGTAEKRWGEIHVVTPTKGDNSEKVATTAYVQAELEDYLALTGGTITGNLSVSGTITGNLAGNADTATNAINATNDGNGNPISTTYLPLVGGTMTGTIIAGFPAMLAPTSAGTVTIAGGAGTGATDGAKLVLNGAEREAGLGEFTIQAGKTGGYKQLVGKPDGTLTWGGNNIATTNNTVNLTGNQTVAGTKTFSSSPIVPTPVSNDNSTKVATTAWVQGNIKNMFTTGIVDGSSFNIAGGNSKADISVNIAKSGYTAIGIIGFWISGSNATFANIMHVELGTSTKATMAIRALNASGTSTWTPHVQVLYVKN